MAKSKKDLLSGAFGTKKKAVPDVEKIEEITNKVYQKEPTKEKKEDATVEEMQKTTLDLPKSLHLKMKMHAMSKGLTIRKYLIGLIKKDMDV